MCKTAKQFGCCVIHLDPVLRTLVARHGESAIRFLEGDSCEREKVTPCEHASIACSYMCFGGEISCPNMPAWRHFQLESNPILPLWRRERPKVVTKDDMFRTERFKQISGARPSGYSKLGMRGKIPTAAIPARAQFKLKC